MFPPFDFSLIIAYLVPGFIAFYSLIFVSQRARVVIAGLFSKETSVGASLFIILSSLAMGMIISALRAFFLDQFQVAFGVKRHRFDLRKLTDPNVRAAFKEAIDNTYRYAQTYGNTCIALTALFAAKFLIYGDSLMGKNIFMSVPLFLIIIFLFFRHRSSLSETHESLRQIDSGVLLGEKKSTQKNIVSRLFFW